MRTGNIPETGRLRDHLSEKCLRESDGTSKLAEVDVN